jgi:hypothetical protein
VLTIETDASETDKNIAHTRDIIRMTICTIAIPHVKTTRIRTVTEMINLAKIIGHMPRLPTTRTSRADTKLIIWR